MAETTLELTPLVGALGVEVSGIDLGEPLGNERYHALHDALMAHRLLVFRNQDLEPDSLIRFGKQFGTLDVHPFIKALPDYPEVLPIVKEADERTNFGGGWHSEVSFYEKPAMGTMLYARDVPSRGGDTLLADGVAAFDALSDAMKEMLETLTAVHSAERVYAPGGAYQRRADDEDATTGVIMSELANKRVEHPVVRTHPVTGEKILYVNRAFTVGIKGMRADESAALLGFLCDHATKSEFCSRLKWQKDTLAFWDNRSTQHYALNDYSGERREMHRIVIEGDRPT